MHCRVKLFSVDRFCLSCLSLSNKKRTEANHIAVKLLAIYYRSVNFHLLKTFILACKCCIALLNSLFSHSIPQGKLLDNLKPILITASCWQGFLLPNLATCLALQKILRLSARAKGSGISLDMNIQNSVNYTFFPAVTPMRGTEQLSFIFYN